MLNPQQFSQPRMFDPGPEGDPEIYFHSTQSSDLHDWSPRRESMHLGTGRAAYERAQSVREGMKSQGSFRVHAGRLTEPVDNLPSMRYSDDMANALYNDEPHVNEKRRAAEEIAKKRAGDEGRWVGEEEAHTALSIRRSIAQQGTGAYYQNRAEDKGSTSVVVRDPTRSVQHLASMNLTPEFERVDLTLHPGPEGAPTGSSPKFRGVVEVRRGNSRGTTPPSWRSQPFFRWWQPSLVDASLEDER